MHERLTIGSFARRSGLSVSALRFYDGAGLLAPADVDPATGYRIYDEAQLSQAELIRDLRRLQMPLAAVHVFLTATDEVRQKTLRMHLDTLSTQLEEAVAIAADISARIEKTRKRERMTTMTVDGAGLAEAIDQVVPAASTDPEFPTLQTVLVEAREGSLRLVATDKYRLAVRDLVPRDGAGAAFTAVVTAAALMRLRQSIDEAADVSVTREEQAIGFGAGGPAGRLPVVPSSFPPYEHLLEPDPEAHSIVVDKLSLTDAVQSSLDRRAMIVTVDADRLVVDGDPPHEIAVSYSGPQLTIGLHPAFVDYALQSAVGPEVMIDVTDPVEPVVFRSATDSSYICLVMPIAPAAPR